MKLSIGDKVLYRQDDKLYKGNIKSIQGDKIEIDDNTIELVIVAVSKNTIADNLDYLRANPLFFKGGIQPVNSTETIMTDDNHVYIK